MRYFLQDGSFVDLTEQDFVAEGGEGKIYVKGQWAYKIATDIQSVLPLAKLKELAQLNHPHIIRPQQLLMNQQQQVVGFSMARLENVTALPRLFTNDFRRQNHIDLNKNLKLLQQVQQTIDFIHQRSCLIVDGNEMNYLIDANTFELAYFIDVDSYQTPTFPATAIMPSIRDYHSSSFSIFTDWFAFAIIACQLLVGIHPFKGKHPAFKANQLEQRMKANISIFNHEVSLPSAVRPLKSIPSELSDWFIRLFERGERCLPPQFSLKAGSIIFTAPSFNPNLNANSTLTLTLLRQFKQALVKHYAYQSLQFFVTEKTYFCQNTEFTPPNTRNYELLCEPHDLTALPVYIEQGFLKFENSVNLKIVYSAIKAEALMLVDNHLWIVQHNKLMHITFHKMSNKLIASISNSWNILPYAHQVLEGCIYQNVLGEPWLIIPYQANSCWMKAIPELKGYRILQGKYEKGVVMLSLFQHGIYSQAILRFDEQFKHYQIEMLQDCELNDINFTVLDNGIIIHLQQDGELNILHRFSTQKRTVQDARLNTHMKLTSNGTIALLMVDEKLYQLSLH